MNSFGSLRLYRQILRLIWLSFFVFGCTSTKVEVFQKQPNTRLDQVYVKPGVDFSRYDKVLIDPPGIWYPQDPQHITNEGDVEKMQHYFVEALTQALEDRYEVVNASGPEVLRLKSQIIDLKLNPPNIAVLPTAKKYKFAMLPGQLTLVGELQDSLTNEVLIRGTDLEKEDQYTDDSVPLSNWDEVKKAFRRWAKIFRAWMDEVHSNTMSRRSAPSSLTPSTEYYGTISR